MENAEQTRLMKLTIYERSVFVKQHMRMDDNDPAQRDFSLQPEQDTREKGIPNWGITARNREVLAPCC